MMYADYDFYKNIYQGALSFDLFNSLLPKACHEIDKKVNKKLTENDINDKVKFVTCELIDYLNKSQKYNNQNSVESITIDGVHKSYGSKNSNEIEKDIKDIIDGLPQEITRYL